MQHPFDGIIASDTDQGTTDAAPSRRSFLAKVVAAFGGLAAILVGGAAWAAPRSRRSGRMTTQAVGEEGGRPTTLAVGEEGGRPTTLAVGEEGGRPSPPPGDGPVTTYALGEEGGGPRPKPPKDRPTTLALGEEGGSPKPRPAPRSK